MAGYITRYQIFFTDNHFVNPINWRIDINKRNDSGSTQLSGIYPLTGGAQPLIIKRGLQGQNKFEPIAGTEYNITFILDGTLPSAATPYFSVAAVPEDFLVSDELQLQVCIYKNGVLFETAFAKADYCQYNYQAYPFEFTLVATDRIATLKSTQIDIQDVINGTGIVRLTDLLLSRGIYKTSVASSLKLYSSLKKPASTGISYPGVSELSFLDELYIRYELLVDNNGQPLFIYDVLKYIANSFGLRLFYSGGYFHAQRINDLYTASPLVSVFTSNPYPDSRSNVPIRKTITGSNSGTDAFYANSNAIIQFEGADKVDSLDLSYVFRGYLLNYSWSAFVSGAFTSWTAYKFVSGSRFTDNSYISQDGLGTKDNPYKCKIAVLNSPQFGFVEQSISVQPGEVYTLEFVITFYACDAAAYQIHLYDSTKPLDYQSINHNFFNGSAWVADSIPQGYGSFPAIGDPFYSLVQNRNKNNVRDNQIKVSIDLPKIPNAILMPGYVTSSQAWVPNTIILDIVGSATAFDDGGADRYVDISLVKLSKKPQYYIGETDKQTSVNQVSISSDNSDSLIIDGYDAWANSMHYGSVNVYDSSFGYWTDDFNNNANTTSYVNAIYPPSTYPLQNAILLTNLNYEIYQLKNLRGQINQKRMPWKVLTTDIYSNTLLFEQILQQAIDSMTLYMQTYDDYDVKACIHSVVLLEIINPLDFTSIANLLRKF